MPTRQPPALSEFVAHVVETMRAFGRVEAKRMFGGWGLYHEGLMFALVAEDTLYLKTDDGNRARFEAEGEGPFVFQAKDGAATVTAYHRPPSEALESPEVMAEWARLGYAAALRKAASSATKAKRPRKPGKPRKSAKAKT